MSAEFHFDATQTADINSGWDLSTPGGQRAWKRMIRNQNILLTVGGWGGETARSLNREIVSFRVVRATRGGYV